MQILRLPAHIYHEVRESGGVPGLLEVEVVAQAHGVHQMVHCQTKTEGVQLTSLTRHAVSWNAKLCSVISDDSRWPK
jgi:hypothetical protein